MLVSSRSFEYNLETSDLRLQLVQREDGLVAKSAVTWTSGLKSNDGIKQYQFMNPFFPVIVQYS